MGRLQNEEALNWARPENRKILEHIKNKTTFLEWYVTGRPLQLKKKYI